MTAPPAETVIRRIFADVWNDGRLDLVDDLVHPDLLVHFGDDEARGSATLRNTVAAWRAGSSDLHHVIDALLVDRDDPRSVVTRFTGTGTHDGTFAGVEPTGRALSYSGVTIWLVADGRVAEAWVYSTADALLAGLAD